MMTLSEKFRVPYLSVRSSRSFRTRLHFRRLPLFSYLLPFCLFWYQASWRNFPLFLLHPFQNSPVNQGIFEAQGGRIVLLILDLYDVQQCRVFERISSNAYEFDRRGMRFHLRKSVVTFAKKIIKVNGTFIELWFQQTLVSRKRNSKIGRQVFKGKINSG